MNIEDRLKQDAARFRDVKPPDNLRSLLQASLENIPALAPPRPVSRLTWFRPAAAMVSLMFIFVLITALYPLQLPGQPGHEDINILGNAGADIALGLIPWLALPGLLGVGALLEGLRREKIKIRVAMASLFIIFLLAVLLLLYNLVPSLRLDLTAHLKPVGDEPTFVSTARLGPALPPKTALVYQGENLTAYWSITPIHQAREHLENQLSDTQVRNMSAARTSLAGRMGLHRYHITLDQFNSRTLIKIETSNSTR